MSKELRTAAKVALMYSFVGLVVILPAVLIYNFQNWRRAMVFIATGAFLLFLITAFLLYRTLLLAARHKQKKHTDKLITKNPKDKQKQ